MASSIRGTVESFGDDGWGVVRDPAGERHPFHSTGIADGTRRIDVGAEVQFRLAPGRQGRREATDLTAR